MRNLLFVIFCICMIGCRPDHKKATTTASITDTLKIKETKNEITSEFISFVEFLDSTGFRYDTLRITKYHHYNELIFPAIYFCEYPFYSVEKTNHRLIKILNETHDPGIDISKIDANAFQKTISITAYPFYWRNENDLFEDGVIEMWSFPNETDALMANREFEKFEGHAYFNTTSFGVADGHYFYLFHSRAEQFCATLENIFNLFIIYLSGGETLPS